MLIVSTFSDGNATSYLSRNPAIYLAIGLFRLLSRRGCGDHSASPSITSKFYLNIFFTKSQHFCSQNLYFSFIFCIFAP